MKINIKTFGISRDILGAKTVNIDFDKKTVGELRQHLIHQYPALAALNSLLIAVNETYADDHVEMKETDEIALIPPVSGG